MSSRNQSRAAGLERDSNHRLRDRESHCCQIQASELVGVISTLSTPVTLDVIVDAVIEAWGDDCSTESWHDLHEELFVVYLPVLDEAGAVTFDSDRGIVEA